MDKDKPIRTFMSYREPVENQSGITVFGRKEDGLFYNYDDHIGYNPCRDGGPTFIDCLNSVVKEVGKANNITARMIEKALSQYHDKPVDVQHIVLGCHLSNGCSWMCFGYTFLS